MPWWRLGHWCKVTASRAGMGAGAQNRKWESRRWHRASVSQAWRRGKKQLLIPLSEEMAPLGLSTTSSAESWSREREWGGTASARSSTSVVKGQHIKRSQALNNWCCYASGRIYLPFLSALLGFYFISLLGTQVKFVNGEHEHFENQNVWLLLEAQTGIF